MLTGVLDASTCRPLDAEEVDLVINLFQPFSSQSVNHYYTNAKRTHKGRGKDHYKVGTRALEKEDDF